MGVLTSLNVAVHFQEVFAAFRGTLLGLLDCGWSLVLVVRLIVLLLSRLGLYLSEVIGRGLELLLLLNHCLILFLVVSRSRGVCSCFLLFLLVVVLLGSVFEGLRVFLGLVCLLEVVNLGKVRKNKHTSCC